MNFSAFALPPLALYAWLVPDKQKYQPSLIMRVLA